VKELEGGGYEYEAAEASLALLIPQCDGKNFCEAVRGESYHVSMRRDKLESIFEATVRVRVGDEIAHNTSRKATAR